MKLTKEQVAENRQSIIETAGRLFREHGFDGVGLADLMKAAGFTHGGFYNHFSSKAALAAEAASLGMKNSTSKLSDALMNEERRGSSGLAKHVEHYLSPAHRDDRAGGCTIASLASDAARGNEEIQVGFARGIEEELNTLASYFAKVDKGQGSAFSARERAIQLMSELLGALILARAVAHADPSLSDQVLQVGRRKILGKAATRTRSRGRHTAELSRRQSRRRSRRGRRAWAAAGPLPKA
jgi:TetR/AcrR family transcriptional regulator, transcriptional repressor for nem operon